jgi:ribonuclease III
MQQYVRVQDKNLGLGWVRFFIRQGSRRLTDYLQTDFAACEVLNYKGCIPFTSTGASCNDSTHFFYHMYTDLPQFASGIGHQFTHLNLLEQALTHSSCATTGSNNQRLEFLGDAVLDLLIAETIFRTYPELDEGALDHLRAAIVNGKSLAQQAQRIGLSQALRVGEAQQQHHPQPSNAMLEDALEALIGAIYLDDGLEAARQFVLQLFGQTIAQADTEKLNKNPKGQLQEHSQKLYAGAVPKYQLICSTGPDHDRCYTAAVAMNGQQLAQGSGSSKKEAELAAARAALQLLEA